MAFNKHLVLNIFLLFVIVVSVTATPLETMLSEENSKCESGTDMMACIKVRAMQFLETLMTKDTFRMSNFEVRPNEKNNGRSFQDDDIFQSVQNYIQGHDVTFDLPAGDAKITVSSRNLNDDELNLKMKFSDNSVVEGKGRKKRLRRIAIPIMVLILLKAMTLIPMAIGILKIKAFNALALGFFSFVVSVGLAIFQLCKKIAAESHSAHITAHGPWDGRSAQIEHYNQIESAQDLAYKGYA